MLAVLKDAVDIYQQYRFIQTRVNARLWREVDGWFTSSDETWPFSFLNICHALSLDAGAVWAGVRGERRP